MQVIGDHTRAVTYLISDGVTPSNVGRGYIVRRLLRRVVMKGRLLGITQTFTPKVAEVAVQLSGACDPQVRWTGGREREGRKSDYVWDYVWDMHIRPQGCRGGCAVLRSPNASHRCSFLSYFYLRRGVEDHVSG